MGQDFKKAGGAPKKDKKLKQDIRCVFFLTEDEYIDLIKQKDSHLSKSEFYRRLLLSKKINRKSFTNYSEINVAINKIGTNINQISKYVNTYNVITEDDENNLHNEISKLKIIFLEFLAFQETE